MIFKEILGYTAECYVDDLVIKSRQIIDHLEHLRIVFYKFHQHQLKNKLTKIRIWSHLRQIPMVYGPPQGNRS